MGKCPATHPAPRLCALVPDGQTAGRRSIAGTKPTPWPTHPARRASVWSNKQTDPYSPPGVLKRHLGRGGQSPLTLATPPGHLRSQARPRALGMALGAPVTHDPAATCPVWAGAPPPLPRMPRPHGRAAAAKGAGRRHHGPLTGAHPCSARAGRKGQRKWVGKSGPPRAGPRDARAFTGQGLRTRKRVHRCRTGRGRAVTVSQEKKQVTTTQNKNKCILSH